MGGKFIFVRLFVVERNQLKLTWRFNHHDVISLSDSISGTIHYSDLSSLGKLVNWTIFQSNRMFCSPQCGNIVVNIEIEMNLQIALTKLRPKFASTLVFVLKIHVYGVKVEKASLLLFLRVTGYTPPFSLWNVSSGRLWFQRTLL